MKKLFGTDGIRARAGTYPLDDKTVALIGSSLSRLLEKRQGRKPRLMIGRDTRESGTQIEAAFSGGASAEGAECVSAGIITTPGLAFLTERHGFDCGVVISASHNPFEDNGIKVFMPSGKKLDEAGERAIEADVAASEPPAVSAFVPDLQGEMLLHQEYMEHLKAASEPLTGLKVVIDCANGAASAYAPGLFKELGAEVVTIGAEPNGRNINQDCGSLHLEKLQAAVKDTQADLGAAFDGDADRCLFVDEKGSVVDGDGVLWIMANELLRNGGLKSRKIVATVMSNVGLEIALRGIGITMERAAVGDKYVLEALIRDGCEIGGEQSGHIIFPSFSLVGDGMMTALRVMNAFSRAGGKFSEMLNGFEQFPQTLVNVRVREKRPFEDVPAIGKAVAEAEAELAGSGRLLLRYSGTENLARIMIEGPDQQQVDRMAAAIADVIKVSLS